MKIIQNNKQCSIRISKILIIICILFFNNIGECRENVSINRVSQAQIQKTNEDKIKRNKEISFIFEKLLIGLSGVGLSILFIFLALKLYIILNKKKSSSTKLDINNSLYNSVDIEDAVDRFMQRNSK